jgi:hypothetical protein
MDEFGLDTLASYTNSLLNGYGGSFGFIFGFFNGIWKDYQILLF